MPVKIKNSGKQLSKAGVLFGDLVASRMTDEEGWEPIGKLRSCNPGCSGYEVVSFACWERDRIAENDESIR